MSILDVRSTYFISGDFDSRKRLLREHAGGQIALCSGITWQLGVCQTNTGQPWCGYRWKIGASAEAFVSVTVDHLTQTQSIPVPAPLVTEMTFDP